MGSRRWPERNQVTAIRSRIGSLGRARRLTDDEFVQRAFLEVLGRPVDQEGRRHFVEQLGAGVPRPALLDQLRRFPEAEAFAARPHLPSLRAERPDRYRLAATDDGVDVPVFTVRHDDDFAWLEEAILRNGFYERPGGWALEDNEDKQVMAAVAAASEPRSVLEIGCSSGAVIGHLLRRGIDAVGVDISEFARGLAEPSVRERIVLGDIAEIDLGRTFDAVLALDVFEHVRPDRVPDLVAGAARHLDPGGLIVANIPAYGADPTFGEPFPMYLPSWRGDAAAGRPFRDVLVDADGYPLHGHLVWASTVWWTDLFAGLGFERDGRREETLQRAHADHFAASPSRRSLFVFRG